MNMNSIYKQFINSVNSVSAVYSAVSPPSRMVFLCFRMLRLCYKKENGVGNGETEYHCKCGATLITALHAVTSFHCVSDDEMPCGKPDVSDGDMDCFFICQLTAHRIILSLTMGSHKILLSGIFRLTL